ncbi:MAG: glycosyltransferase family 2 protein [Bacteroidota bacterium]
MMTNDLVSVITPTYNSEKYIGETIKSVIAQTYPNWELIITDDASSDNTLTIVSEYARLESRIHFYQFDKNRGPAEARNNSILKSRGRYVAFIDSDDLWEPKKLAEQIDLFKKEPLCPLVYTGYNIINGHARFVKYQKVPPKATYNDILKSCSIGCSTVMLNLSITGQVYMPLLKRRQDFALWLKILKNHGTAIGINEPLANYRKGASTVSSNKLKVIRYQWRTYFKIEKLGLIKSIYYITHWAFRGFFKHYL